MQHYGLDLSYKKVAENLNVYNVQFSCSRQPELLVRPNILKDIAIPPNAYTDRQIPYVIEHLGIYYISQRRSRTAQEQNRNEISISIPSATSFTKVGLHWYNFRH